VARYGIPQLLFEELIEGVCMDAGPVRIDNFDELHLYCYRVASVVGLMMSRIFGLKDPAGEERAIQMGVAMQLTNILRDVREDLQMNRIYLPAEELGRFGLTEEDLRLGKVTGSWHEFMKFQIERARRYYREGEKGIHFLAPDGSRMAVALMSRVYSGILSEIERANYDVFRGRVHVSLPRKLGLALQAWRDMRAR
jgi:phytoene synthase